MNYFADRHHTELILRKIEKKLKLAAFTAKNVRTSRNFSGTKKMFKWHGFCTFNKDILYWNVYNPDWSKGNPTFRISPIRNIKFRV